MLDVKENCCVDTEIMNTDLLTLECNYVMHFWSGIKVCSRSKSWKRNV